MKNKELASEFAVGLFTTAIFLGLFVFTIVISGKDLLNKGVHKIEIVMPDAMGLRANDAVYSRGAPVGTVTRVEFAEDGVHVDAKLDKPLTIHEGYRISVVATSILGGRQVVIEAGDQDAPAVPSDEPLVGEMPSDLMSEATAVVARIKEALDDATVQSFKNVVTNLDSFSADLRSIGGRLERGEGTLGKLLSSDDSIYTNLVAIVSDLKDISGRLERGEGTLGRLLSSNDEVYTNLNATVENLRVITERVENGEGTLGKLLSSDDAVYADLQATLANLRGISERLEKGEGSLGKLLSSDSSLIDNVDGAVTDARELLDDLREANTLSTFTSMLMSGF